MTCVAGLAVKIKNGSPSESRTGLRAEPKTGLRAEPKTGLRAEPKRVSVLIPTGLRADPNGSPSEIYFGNFTPRT